MDTPGAPKNGAYMDTTKGINEGGDIWIPAEGCQRKRTHKDITRGAKERGT